MLTSMTSPELASTEKVPDFGHIMSGRVRWYSKLPGEPACFWSSGQIVLQDSVGDVLLGMRLIVLANMFGKCKLLTLRPGFSRSRGRSIWPGLLCATRAMDRPLCNYLVESRRRHRLQYLGGKYDGKRSIHRLCFISTFRWHVRLRSVSPWLRNHHRHLLPSWERQGLCDLLVVFLARNCRWSDILRFYCGACWMAGWVLVDGRTPGLGPNPRFFLPGGDWFHPWSATNIPLKTAILYCQQDGYVLLRDQGGPAYQRFWACIFFSFPSPNARVADRWEQVRFAYAPFLIGLSPVTLLVGTFQLISFGWFVSKFLNWCPYNERETRFETNPPSVFQSKERC